MCHLSGHRVHDFHGSAPDCVEWFLDQERAKFRLKLMPHGRSYHVQLSTDSLFLVRKT